MFTEERENKNQENTITNVPNRLHDEIMAITTRAFHRKLFLQNAPEDVLGELSHQL